MTFFAARQPILDLERNVFAYELLFRESMENVFPGTDQDAATAKMIDELQHNLGLTNLAKDKLAFVNFTYESLVQGFPLLLPKEQVVVEILETALPDERLLAICINLKERGYRIALDDYQHHEKWLPFLSIVDIVKVDFQLSTPTQVAEISRICQQFPSLSLLAEKIELYEEFRCATDLGFRYFQGYFFSKPEVVTRKSFAPSQLALANLISLISQPDPDHGKMLNAIKSDINLSYKLLHFSRSTMEMNHQGITDIEQTLEVIDAGQLRRFVMMLLTAQVSEKKPSELTLLASNRAYFCEQVCCLTEYSERKASAFLVGMLSLLGAMLDAEIEELLSELALSEEIKFALLGDDGPLSIQLHLCVQFEQGNWAEAKIAAEKLNITMQQANECYLKAIRLSAEHMRSED